MSGFGLNLSEVGGEVRLTRGEEVVKLFCFRSLKTWGCIGIRQDDLGLLGCIQGISLSPLRSVSEQ